MHRSFSAFAVRSLRKSRLAKGFTLIEIMIVVAILTVLIAIALPQYRDFVLRGQLLDGTNLLSAAEANMERYFQDNRTYAATGAPANRFPPCDNSIPVAQRTNGYFVLTCTGPGTPTALAYTLTATGSGPVAGVLYTVNETRAQTTAGLSGIRWAAPVPNTCWVTKRGQAC
jgi:type IV pilus assembly protein PilE